MMLANHECGQPGGLAPRLAALFDPALAPYVPARDGEPRRKVRHRALGEDRPVSVYVPPAAGDAPGVLMTFDRDTYLIAGELPTMLDAMIAAGCIPPTILATSGPELASA